ncbi:MAG: prolyl oligopeptidase family serine peptidase [Actinomycetota bacterium]|nr:prolyl oligopeptidase family serine peptidase [Actinomycetota bacterium]
MLFRIAATSAVGAIVLAVLGAVTGPDWSPQPLPHPIDVETSSTVVGGAPEHGVGQFEVESEVVPIELDGTRVQARLLTPVGAAEPVPAAVFVHGAGTGRFADAFGDQARELAAAGIATLVPDKRLDTYSTRHRDYVGMAADYARSVEALRAVDGVDARRVGIYAESEGGWIAPVMAAQDPSIAFVVLASAPVVPPRQQAAFAVDAYLRNTGVPLSVFRAIPRAVGMQFPGGGFEYADFDVQPWQQRVTQPVFMAYGTDDASMPVVQAAQQFIADAATAGNDQVTVRYYEGANHGIKVDGALATGFVRDLATWVHGLPGTAAAPPRVAGAEPFQGYLAEEVPQPRWFGDGDLVLGVVIAGAALIVLGPVILLGGHLARRKVRLARGLSWPLAAFAAGCLGTVALLVWYLVAIARLALEYERNALVVQGGWVAVRLAGLVTVVALAVLVERSRVERAEPGGALAAGRVGYVGAFSVLAGGTLLLVSLAYWGAFQLGI